ncbi:MAG: response regulator transcription factor, partial [Microcystis sp.]
MRILIVEDDPLMQLGLEQALGEQPDFEIVGQASDGLAGVQLALSLRPDLVVMDIGLPRLDVIAATKQIKEGLANVHVVMLTSHTLQ